MFQPRIYRQLVSHDDLVISQVRLQETDLQIAAVEDLHAVALEAVRAAREQLNRHAREYPEFLTSLTPLPLPPHTPEVPRQMYMAAERAGVGPMAAVAGAVAEYVGERLLLHSPQIIIENGGDIFLCSQSERIVAIHAGQSSLSGKLGLRLPAVNRLGICTSSGTVGHSISFGQADAALVICANTALADALATALGNRVKQPADVAGALEWIQTIPDVRYALVIIGETLGAWGEYELVMI